MNLFLTTRSYALLGALLLAGCASAPAQTAPDAAAPAVIEAALPTAAKTTSELLGTKDQTLAARLPDWSHAGYHAGDDPIPDVPVVKNVKTDFGAKGDGQTDDTQAFIDAIEGTDDGALLIPAGRYIITKPLFIRKSNLVLRGEGPDKTILMVPKPLLDAQPEATLKANWGFTYMKADNNWRFRGAFVWFDGADTGTKITDVTAGAKRGDTQLRVANASQIAVGDWVRLVLTDDAKHTLGRHLHADQADLGPTSYKRNGDVLIDWAAQVTAKDGNELTLDRPLRVDVRGGWRPAIFAMKPTVQECGVENLGFEFAGESYPGHLKEKGYNAIYWSRAVNCWARDVWVTDADIAFNLEEKVRFCTVTDVRILADKRPEKKSAWDGTGHHGVQLAYLVQDCLIQNFRFDTHYVHDISVDSLPNGNVFSHGSGLNINFDHHRGAPFDNLFTDIDVGDPSRLWVSSGQPAVGPPAGARETFWNIRTQNNKPAPKVPDWIQVNVVGLPGVAPEPTPGKRWIEPLDPDTLTPRNLYQAQLARRKAAR